MERLLTSQKIVFEPSPAIGSFKYVLETTLMAKKLSSMDGNEILKKHESEIKDSFSNNGLVMLISTYNEEKDLPRLLFALSKSSIKIRPIVVDNGSEDGTKDILKSLNIETIYEPKPGLVNTRKAFFDFLKSSSKDKTDRFICTDADGIPGRLWAESMQDMLNRLPENGGNIFGLYWYYGGSLLSDTLLSSTYLLKTNIYTFLKNKVSAHGGGNFGIKFDNEGKILNGLCNLDTNVTTGNSLLIKQIVLKNEGVVVRNMNPLTLSFTRSDRYPDLKSVFKLIFKSQEKIMSVYKDWYERHLGYDYATHYNEWI